MERKEYTKPALSHVELRADEAVLSGCKQELSASCNDVQGDPIAAYGSQDFIRICFLIFPGLCSLITAQSV